MTKNKNEIVKAEQYGIVEVHDYIPTPHNKRELQRRDDHTKTEARIRELVINLTDALQAQGAIAASNINKRSGLIYRNTLNFLSEVLSTDGVTDPDMLAALQTYRQQQMAMLGNQFTGLNRMAVQRIAELIEREFSTLPERRRRTFWQRLLADEEY